MVVELEATTGERRQSAGTATDENGKQTLGDTKRKKERERESPMRQLLVDRFNNVKTYNEC